MSGKWTGQEFVSNNDGSETRFSHQDENGNYMSVTRTEGTNGDSHVTQSYNSNGEVINTHTTEVNGNSREHYGSEDLKNFPLGAVSSAYLKNS